MTSFDLSKVNLSNQGEPKHFFEKHFKVPI